MLNERLFLDIRYYESDHENVFGMSLPGGIGRIYSLPKSIHSLGARIARKLREFGFVAGTFDHLYVNFTTAILEGMARYSTRDLDGRIKYIDFGLSPEKINGLSDAAKESFICATTFEILKFVAGDRPSQIALVDRVCADIEVKGSELEILHKTKETAAFSVTVTYQIRPNGSQSVGLVEFHDKKSGQRLKSEFLKLNTYEDVFAIVGAISVSRGIICLKPRPSFKASLYTKAYKVPIEIPIAELNVCTT
jgi:hypothetical protein